ncbi:RHS repeat domain-containing protein [Undibacterium sp. TJN25]|uniref:RHS repeat domain-containing protein n=1 Tax=Undibacterium sp. TJN25 TaxID=3413056 RepID=UPI003BF2857F
MRFSDLALSDKAELCAPLSNFYRSSRIYLPILGLMRCERDHTGKITLPMLKIVAGITAALAMSYVHAAPTPTIFTEQGKLIRAPEAVTTLGTDLFGDQVNLYHGGLEFIQSDVSLPGNNNLPVAVGRRLQAGGKGNYGAGHFLEWDLEIPHIHGMFSTVNGWQKLDGNGQLSSLRCTNFGAPPDVIQVSSASSLKFRSAEIWNGNLLYVPGEGDQEILKRNLPGNPIVPTDGVATNLVTKKLWAVRCLSSLASTTASTPVQEQGEGFLAISPDGTKYRFDWLVSRGASALSKPATYGPTTPPISLPPEGPPDTSGINPKPSSSAGSNAIPNKGGGVAEPNGIGRANFTVPRTEVWILPTLVTDRFGNTVTYTYDTVDKWKLLSIQSSDGRAITLTYVPGTHQIQTVSDGTRTWTYGYAAAASGGSMLTAVTLPDSSSWQLAGLDGVPISGDNTASHGLISVELALDSDTAPFCDQMPGAIGNPAVTGTMVHPSGAIGSFTMTPISHGRNGVPLVCYGDGTDWSAAYFPAFINAFSLTNKTISGPGLPNMSWTTSYDTFHPGWDTCPACIEPNIVSVTDPKGDITRYTFGSTFRVNEGLLQKVDIGWNGSTALKTTTTQYDSTFTQPLGYSDQDRGDGVLNTHLMPEKIRAITQQGSNFNWQVNLFDTLARPTSVTKSSSLGFSRTENTTYDDKTIPWILGQILTVTESSGIEMERNAYDPSTAALLSTTKFGILDKSYTYNPDGTLLTTKDGANNTTTFSNYKRGLAQNIQYQDGAIESAIVSNIGLINSLTDAAGFTTGYSYDAMGRLSRIVRAGGDSVAWNDTTILFEPVGSTEMGLAPGHWRQTTAAGNANTITYVDALWRPVLSNTYDASIPSTTSKMVLRKFDHNGKVVFESFPQRSINSVVASPDGTSSVYDALGRPTSSVASSELGPLTTSTYYLTGYQTQVINPRGNATTNGFQAFDEPIDSAPISINAPEGLTVNIARDLFGKTNSITRSGGGKSAIRSYVYDANQRLCKTIEPETGATLQDYDSANNVSWRAIVSSLTSLTCDRSSVPAASKINYAYDTRNRLSSTTYGDGSPSIGRTYKPDGLPSTVSSNGSTWTTDYYNRRLPKQETLSYSGQNYFINYNYDANGHLSQLVYPDADRKAINYAPNALGEATQVGAYATGVTYHPNGAIAGFTYGNGITHTLTQNTRGLPQMSKDTTVLQDLYSYDANANVASITDQQENITNRTMGYDNLDRLTSVSAPNVWSNATYAYDVLDNLTGSTIGSRSNLYSYDGQNRLSSFSSNVSNFNFTYGYDGQGNISQRGSQLFSFDQGNRLSSATGKATYAYDGLGHRTKTSSADGTMKIEIYTPAGQLLYSSQSGGSNPANTVRYIYINRHLIAEVSK